MYFLRFSMLSKSPWLTICTSILDKWRVKNIKFIVIQFFNWALLIEKSPTASCRVIVDVKLSLQHRPGDKRTERIPKLRLMTAQKWLCWFAIMYFTFSLLSTSTKNCPARHLSRSANLRDSLLPCWKVCNYGKQCCRLSGGECLTVPGGLQKAKRYDINNQRKIESFCARLHSVVGPLFAFRCGFTLATHRSDHCFIFNQRYAYTFGIGSWWYDDTPCTCKDIHRQFL